MKTKVDSINVGDIIRLPKVGFRIISETYVESQSKEVIKELFVEGVNDPFHGVKGRFLVCNSDTLDVITRNNWWNRLVYRLTTKKGPEPITNVSVRSEIPYNPFNR